MKGERRGALLVLGVLVVSAVLGGMYGPSVRATVAGTTDLQDSIKNFTKVLSVVQQEIRILRFSIRASTRCCAKTNAVNTTA